MARSVFCGILVLLGAWCIPVYKPVSHLSYKVLLCLAELNRIRQCTLKKWSPFHEEVDFFAWSRNLVKDFGKQPILFLIYDKIMFKEIGVALSLWLCWWAKNLLFNVQDWCWSASYFEGNEYMCEYIHFAMKAKWKKNCYQTTSCVFFIFCILSQLCLIQHDLFSRNFLECQRNLVGEFLSIFLYAQQKGGISELYISILKKV